MASYFSVLGCQRLAILLVLGVVTCSAADDQCTENEDANARSMLNLAMRMNKNAGTVHEQKAKQELPSLSALFSLPEENETSQPSDTTVMKAYSIKPPIKKLNGQEKRNSSEQFPEVKEDGLPGDVVVTTVVVKCDEPVFAPLGSCPDACPFFTSTGDHCMYQCVSASDCGSINPDDRVADKELGVCRPCNNRGCDKCAPGHKDKCAKCKKGYSLGEDDECYSDYMKVWLCIFVVLGLVFLFLIIWLIQLMCAPITNAEGLQEGLAFRSRVKMHKPQEDPSENRELWPISTNLHVTRVGGPGLTLHMNFQLASMLWACVLLVVWITFVYNTDARQLTIGMIPAATGPELCAVTLQGRVLQEEQMLYKVIFIIIVYLITFIGCIVYGVINWRAFEIQNDDTTMMDFAALVTGLPKLRGNELWEDKLKQFFMDKTGETVIGVSICWDYGAQADEFQDFIEQDHTARENYPPVEPYEDTRGTCQKSVFGGVDNLMGAVFGLDTPGSETPSIDHGALTQSLKDMTSTDSAFVVFQTEDARDRAVETSKKGSSKGLAMMYDGQEYILKLQMEICEPDVVLWENFNVTTGTFVFRLCCGVIGIIVACVIYAVAFYLPYAYYQSMFKFPNEPGAAEGFLFSMLVVAGNQIMYQVCAAIADWTGFRFRDRAEGIYVALYVLAVLLSVIFDMTVEFYLGYTSMAEAGVDTADGRNLKDLVSYQEIFESYPMQKVLGKRLFDYCFPATFLVPFIMEPIGTIVTPFFIQKLLLRTHPEVRHRHAEKSVACFAPFDLGRYGDIVINLWLLILIFFFPSGSTLPLLLTYVVSHLYIYCYDQYKILRCVPQFEYTTDEVDKYTQHVLILPCATLAACIVFKANCAFADSFCYRGWEIAGACALAFVGHAILHEMLLLILVPMLGGLRAHEKSTHTYEMIAKKRAVNWFTANPMFCLRSKYIYQHEPACCYWMLGKQHLIRRHATIGLHYENRKKAPVEEFE